MSKLLEEEFDNGKKLKRQRMRERYLPKNLQKLLGHASIKTTMDRYVHVTSESLDQAVRLFESNRVSDIKVHAEMA